MHNFYCSRVLCILLLSRPAIPFLFINTVSLKAVPSQIAASNYQNLFRGSYLLQEHVSDYVSFDTAPSNFGAGGASYSSLLLFYLSQNLKPKFDLCSKVITKIIDQEGLDATIKICESLQATVSAESYHLANNALLSVMISLRLPEAASSHLSRLLQQVNGELEPDAFIIADLLKLYMPTESDDYTTLSRRKVKKRALEASALYTDIITHLKFTVDGRTILRNGSSVERGYYNADVSEESSSCSAADSIHEYGARALASSSEWERALAAVACIGQQHLSRPQMKTFTMQLLQRLLQIDSNQQQQQQQQQVPTMATASALEVSSSRSESLALSLALLQPLNLFPVDCPLLHACLLQLSTSPMHIQTVISRINELRNAGSDGKDAGSWRERGSGVATMKQSSYQLGSNLYSFSRLFPAKVSMQLVKGMFLSGCDSAQLVDAIDCIWMGGSHDDDDDSEGQGQGQGQGQGAVGYRVEDRDDVTGRAGSAVAVEQQWMRGRRLSALTAIEVAVQCACLLRDARAGDFNDRHEEEQISVCAAVLPSKINMALSPVTATATATATLTVTPSSSSVQMMVLEASSCAIDASLLVLTASLRAIGQQKRISTLLQSMADYNAPSLSDSSMSDTAAKSDKLALAGSGRIITAKSSAEESMRGVWTSRWTWSPNTDLLAQALDLQSDSSSSSSSSSEVEKGGEREERNELLAYKEVTARIRSGKAVDAFALSALFRGATRVYHAPHSLACETAGRSLWGAMAEAKLPCCYTDMGVLAPAVLFAFSAGDRDTGRVRDSAAGRDRNTGRDRDTGRDREIGGGDLTDLQQQQNQLQGEGQGQGQGQSVEVMSMGISKSSFDQPLGIQVCLDAVSAAASTSETEGAATVHRLFVVLMDMRTQLVDGSEVEDAPRAVLSHLLRLSSLKGESVAGSDSGSGSDRIVAGRGRGSGGLVIDEETLALGAVLSLGVPSLSKKGAEVVEGWNCRYSSLLRLSLYLSCVPEDRLLSLLSSLMRRGDQWPKILLKSFSHLHTVTTSSSSSSSSSSSDTGARIAHSPSESPHTTVEDTGSRTARMVLQVFDSYLVEELEGQVSQREGTASLEDPLPVSAPRDTPLHSSFVRDSIAAAVIADPRSGPLGDAALRYADCVPSRYGSGSGSKSLHSSGTLSAAIDLCCSVPSMITINTPHDGKNDKKGRKEVGNGRPGKDTETSEPRQHARCKLYYSIGWLAAGYAGDRDRDGGSDQRQLGVSLNQLSYTLLRAAQKLSMPVSEAMGIVRHKMDYFSSKISAVSGALPIPDLVKGSGEVGPVMTHVVAAAVTYREARLLSAIATAGPRGSRKQLRDFWFSVMTAQRGLLHYSTALFEVLDAHMAVGDGIGATVWARKAVKSRGTLPPMRVKELLLRYSATRTLHCLPALLPLLTNLSESHSEMGYIEEEESTYDGPVTYSYGLARVYLPLSMAVLRTVCVDLLAQGRLSDADALLKCVHPFQWPYDELLLALTQAPKPSEGNGTHTRSGELISRNRLRRCLSALRKREELPLPLAPIRSATAKALLAIHADVQAEGEVAQSIEDKKKGNSSSSDVSRDSHQALRVMVARAIRTEYSTGRDSTAGRAVSSTATKLDNNNGRLLVSGSNGSSNAVSEEDVRSGLMALLTLYSLTDNTTDKREGEATSGSTDAATLSSSPDPLHQMSYEEGMAGGGEKDAEADTVPFKWVDPESPENLLKFLSDIESLGRGTGQGVGVGVGGGIGAGAGAGVGARVRAEGTEQQRAGSVGLRVQGSKKSWKRKGTYGTFFDGGNIASLTAPAPASVTAPVTDPNATVAASVITSAKVATTAAAAIASAGGGAVLGDVDVLVCKELATSLLSSVLTQIATVEDGLQKIDQERARETEREVESEKERGVERILGKDSVVDRLKERERVLIRGSQKEFRVSLKGAVRELYCTENQVQADRLFACYEDIGLLCSKLLHLCALIGDAASAAVVLEQISLQGMMPFRDPNGQGLDYEQDQDQGQGQEQGHSKGRSQGEGQELWKSVHTIMLESARMCDRIPPASALAVWGDVQKIFTIIRDDLLIELEPKPLEAAVKEAEDSEERDDQSTHRTMCTQMLEVGIFSLLKSLPEVVREVEQGSAGSVMGYEGDQLNQQRLEARSPSTASTPASTSSSESESVAVDEHWMRAGERERAKDFMVANQNRNHASKQEALTLARADVFRLVQRFPALNLKVSDTLGSQLICSFLSHWGDVDAALAVLNILLRSGGHASDAACELLARQLLSTGRQPMATAICRLMHRRGRLCSTSFYSFLFTTLLRKGKETSNKDDKDKYWDTDQDKDKDRDRLRGRGSGSAAAASAAAGAVLEAHELLQDIALATLTPPRGSETLDSTLNGVKLKEIAVDLAQILMKLGYPHDSARTVYSIIEQKDPRS